MCCIHREIVRSYSIQVRELGFRIQELISESLGLEKDHIKNVLGEQGQHMAVNFYPPCPEPELTYGLPAHTDPNALTILLQDLSVAGLQVLLKDGKWVAVNPHPDAFVINIGDQLQVNLHFLLPRRTQNECRWAARLNGNEHFHVLVCCQTHANNFSSRVFLRLWMIAGTKQWKI